MLHLEKTLAKPDGLLQDPVLIWDDWSISKPLAESLRQRLHERRPQRILELGSGTSTAVLAAYAARHDAEIVSLEHDAAFHERTAGMLEALGLRRHVDLRLAPCEARAFDRNEFPAYQAALNGTFDFVFVDGPTLALGREATLFFVWPHLADDWEIWLKDGAREHEKSCVRRWKHHFAFTSRLDLTDGRGVLILNNPDPGGSSAGVAAGSAGLPLVSCIMPTHNRRRFVPLAIQYFLAQDYPHRELVIVDDGSDRVEDLVPDDPRIRYIRLDRRRSIGAKRNLACRHARGELIAHWDDDDWMASWRLSYQIEELQAHNADICGVDRIYFYNPQERKAWQYRYAGGKSWVAGGTLCYRKRIWADRGFDDISNGEDTRFVWRAATRRILALEDRSFYVGIVHGHNSSPKNTRSPRWHARPLAEIYDVVGEASQALYEAMYAGPVPSPKIGEAARTEGDVASVRHDAERVHREKHPRITVSIPCYKSTAYLRRAVESMLRQSYTNLRIVVMNDGDEDAPWDVLSDVDDPRLVRFDLAENRGRYFADAVVLAASDDPYFLAQDADDWSEPHRVERLLQEIRSARADAALPAIYKRHAGRADTEPAGLQTYPELTDPLTKSFEHRSIYVAGLFRSEALTRIGGCYGGFRIGYDTLLVNLLLMTGSVTYVDEPLYTYFLHDGSLTSDAETGFDSSARAEVWKQLHEIYDELYGIHVRFRDEGIGGSAVAEIARQVCDRNVSAPDRIALQEETVRLRSVLEALDVKAERSTAEASDESTAAETRMEAAAGLPSTDELLADPELPWNEWTVSQRLARSVLDRLSELKPQRILELGSGTSTVLLAHHAARHGAEVVTLEHDALHFCRTQRILRQFGLEDHVRLTYAPLGPKSFRSARTSPWYRAALRGPYDFVFIDGPPARYGRQAALFSLKEHLSDAWEVWLKDGRREHEQDCLELWSRHIAFSKHFSDADPRGVWVLGPPSKEVPAITPPTKELPLVSCIMPTYNRRRFVAQAVTYFQRQDYPNRELIVVDDGTDPVGDILPRDDRVRYHRINGRRSTGVKRNMACQAARGKFIVMWDDDDWYAPNRISYQVAPLLDDQADVSGLGPSLIFCIRTDRFWMCDPQLHAKMFYERVVGGTLAFRTDDWRTSGGFPDCSVAEDARFLGALLRAGARLAKLPNADAFVYVRHGANSWRFRAGRFRDPAGWRQVSPPAFIPPSDLTFYSDLQVEAKAS